MFGDSFPDPTVRAFGGSLAKPLPLWYLYILIIDSYGLNVAHGEPKWQKVAYLYPRSIDP
jgi:hypothetical protein